MPGVALRSPEWITQQATHLPFPWEKGVIPAAQKPLQALPCKGCGAQRRECRVGAALLPAHPFIPSPWGPKLRRLLQPSASRARGGREFCEAVW